jgi:hypothetical protein
MQKYSGVAQQYGSPQALAQQDPQLMNQMVNELSQSSDPQDQAAYQQLASQGYVAGGYGGGFVVHPEMKQAMTKQQEAYAPKAVPQKSNAEQAVEAMQKQAQANVQGKNIVQASVQAEIQEPVLQQPVLRQGPVLDASYYAPKSDYWKTPTPETIGKVGPIGKTDNIKIEPPAGYAVTNMRPTVIEDAGVQKDAVAYELIEKPKFVQQSDLGIGSQLLIAADVFGKIVTGKTKEDTVINKLIRAETDYALKPLLYFEIGGINAVESEIYGTASLINSAKVSLEKNKLQYVPVKTPKLGPTVVGSSIGLVTGSPQEAQQMNEMPFGYQLGSAFGEVGIAVVGGEVTGFVGGKASTFVKTIVNPRVNTFAESTLARSTRLFESAANRIEPGLGKASELVVSRRVASVGAKLDIVGAKTGAALTNKIVDPIKYGAKFGIVEPAKARVGLIGERIAASPVGKGVSFVRQAVPDLKVYSRSIAGKYGDDLVSQPIKDLKLATESFREAPKNLVKGLKETGVYQKANYAKVVQAPNSEMAQILRATPKASKFGQKLSLRSVEELNQAAVLRAEQNLLKPASAVSKSSKALKFEPISNTLSVGRKVAKQSSEVVGLKPVSEALVSGGKTLKSGAKAVQKLALSQEAPGVGTVFNKGVTSSKNIATFEALSMAKEAAKQGKRLTQITPYPVTAPIAPSVKPSVDVKQMEKQTSAMVKESTMSSGMPSIAQPYPGTRQRMREDTELTFVSYPQEVSGGAGGKGEMIPIITPSFTPTVDPGKGGGRTDIIPIVVPVVTPDVKPVPGEDVVPIPKPRPVPPSVIPNIVPVEIPGQTPIVTPIVTPGQWQPQPEPTTPKFDIPQITLPDFPKSPRTKNAFPNFGLGGGGGGGGSLDRLTGKWRKQKNPIKSPKAMLETFGVNTGRKRSGGKRQRSNAVFGLNSKVMGASFSSGNFKVKGLKGFGVGGKSSFRVPKMGKVDAPKMGKAVFSANNMSKVGRLNMSAFGSVGINTKIFKQPRKRYNKVKQRRSRKR